jgi:hypothetical protein
MDPVLLRYLQTPRPEVPKDRPRHILDRELLEWVETGIREGVSGGLFGNIDRLLEEGAHPGGKKGARVLEHAIRGHAWELARFLVSRGAILDGEAENHDRKWVTLNIHLVMMAEAWEGGSPEDQDWVDRVVNKGQLVKPGVTLEIQEVRKIITKFPHALAWFMKNPGVFSTDVWLEVIVENFFAHQSVDPKILDAFLALPPPGKDSISRVWYWSLCHETPAAALEFLSTHYPEGLMDGIDDGPHAWLMLSHGRGSLFLKMMAIPEMEENLNAWLALHPKAFEALFCVDAYYQSPPMVGLSVWQALLERGLLPKPAVMETWEEAGSFCLRQFIQEGLLTPAMLDWVNTHWHGVLEMGWLDSLGQPTLMEELDNAHAKGLMSFNGRVRLEQRWLEKSLSSGLDMEGASGDAIAFQSEASGKSKQVSRL